MHRVNLEDISEFLRHWFQLILIQEGKQIDLCAFSEAQKTIQVRYF